MQTESSRGGWTEEGEEDKAGDGGRDGEGRTESGEKREGGGQEDRRKPGTSRFCYDQWQTGTQRAPFVSIQERLLRWTLRGVPLSPGSPHPSSPRILRLPRFSDPGRAAPHRTMPGHAVFSFCSCDLSLALPCTPRTALSSIACSRLKCDTYWSPDVLNLISYSKDSVCVLSLY